MIEIVHVLGSRLDPEFSERLHDLGHRDEIDTLVITVSDLSRRRLLAKTTRGVMVAIALPREEKLYDGAILYLSEKQAIVVKAPGERWLRCDPASLSDAIELGYHAGNLHWRVRFDGAALLVALEGRAEDYIARIEPMISGKRVRISILDGDDFHVHDHDHDHHGHHHHSGPDH